MAELEPWRHFSCIDLYLHIRRARATRQLYPWPLLDRRWSLVHHPVLVLLVLGVAGQLAAGLYLLGWEERMKSIGGTGRYEVSDELSADTDGHILRWAWWCFVGTEVAGSTLLKIGDEGVIYERIAYYKPL